MCGRFSFVTSPEKLRQQLGDIETGENLKLSFNIAPTQHAYVLTNEEPGRLNYYRWGLIPHWAKDSSNASKLINARMEGIGAKPSFRVPVRKRRCLVIADSFYEWRTEGKQKTPFRILPKDDSLLVMAGIWDIWHDGDYAVKTFSIITAPPNAEVAPLHNRMPLLLPTPKAQQRWIADLNVEEVMNMLQPPPDGLLKKYQVSDRVNNVRNNTPDLHEKVGEQGRLF
jgi:putative SOS response-associated peptidase YedK